ncbi:hypothetical protein B4589_006910 [Halolamina sp. CBA1230]|uniref:hypothetical protein n=1 Tax=Halolamina sp. CBA1230 TaxID=1853690 RepID=UPI0009A1BA7B|nr:hypothetical protein [Halolamina sp. CBA1230]QKY20122.1 hypothetical protein B4589_006910 [Halolamina sp. CBA1230]
MLLCVDADAAARRRTAETLREAGFDVTEASSLDVAREHVADVLDGLGVLLIDPTIHDDRTVSTLSQFCTGRIDVREGEAGPELRARGLPEQPRERLAFDPVRRDE